MAWKNAKDLAFIDSVRRRSLSLNFLTSAIDSELTILSTTCFNSAVGYDLAIICFNSLNLISTSFSVLEYSLFNLRIKSVLYKSVTFSRIFNETTSSTLSVSLIRYSKYGLLKEVIFSLAPFI